MSRNIYIDNTNVEKALDFFLSKLSLKRKTEKISVLDSLGRVLSKSIFAQKSSPNYSASAMDGIFLWAEKTYTATETSPVFLKAEDDFIYLNTGNPIDYSKGNSVIMIEDVIPQENGTIKLIKSAKPWQNIRPIGEDIVQGEMILKENHVIRPHDLGALISSMIKEIEVIKKPRVAIIPTGDEIVDIFKEEFKENSIIDSNSYVFYNLLKEWGAEPIILPKVSDNLDLIATSINEASKKYDCVLISAGSSAGSKDYTKSAIETFGEVFIHGVALKPGKPTILGACNHTPVIGIPGYPVSAFMAMETFLKPIINFLTSMKPEESFIHGQLSKTIVSSLKHKELIRVALHFIDDKLLVTPLSRGAGITMSLVKADGILEVPQNIEGISQGEMVKVKLLKPLSEIKDYLISIGSHDIIMDLISDKIKLTSTHVGSFGGILAVKTGKTHLAPIHILDEDKGTYNIEIIKKYFPNNEVAIIKGIRRTQGIIVEKNNPLNITSLKDLTKSNIYFFNRQRGAGTRILLDHLLKKENISPKEINGYEREGNTHLEVAMAIKTGIANCGLGIQESAHITNLDFIPLKEEEYDFLVLKSKLQDPKIQEFINFLKSEFFNIKITSLPGYSLKNPGEVILIHD